MPKPTIFISHSHHDNEWCRGFVEALQRLEFDVWYDEKGLSGGTEWVRMLEHELENRQVYVLVLTPHSWASSWVQQELHLALSSKRKIVPIILESAEVTGFLRNYQQIHAMGKNPRRGSCGLQPGSLNTDSAGQQGASRSCAESTSTVAVRVW